MASFKAYPQTDPNPDLAAFEKQVQKFWQDNDIFKKSVESKDNSKHKEYIFYDGPPFANGLPHYGHLLTGFVKDIFARYHTMLGQKTVRRFGWDTHGLPVEMETEKELGVSGRTAIEEFGIAKFNDSCRQSVMKYSKEWQEYVTRQGRFVDFKNSYKTMDINYMESVIWAFKQLYDKGLIYEDLRVMPYSWACQTPLSNFETRLDNAYREKESKAVTLNFELKDKPAALADYATVKILVWTTTPWTLPSNLALAVGAEINYVAVKKADEVFIIAQTLAAKYVKELAETEELEIIAEFTGQDLVGLTYQPLFNYLAGQEQQYDLSNAFKIYAADFVTTEDGTGVVHIAPGFGEDDQELCKQENIPTICPVDEAGKFTFPVTDFEGLQVFAANVPIIKKLKEQGNWLRTEQYFHNYPHCWRSDTPLIYRAMPSWYVKVTDFKERMVELNQQINWIPGHIKDGLFGKWLENARDWSISRNRFWGCPVPVWRSDDPKYPRIDVYGSLAEIARDFGVKPDNLHRPFIDELTRPNPDDPTGKSTMRRVTDVLDCWFESGSMPYAQKHYPFSCDEDFTNNFPADFIVEYTAQTRGWFYTLMVLSTALFDSIPFKNCICHGVILDDQAQKLSKRLKNYTSPLVIFEKYGADAMRYFMGASPVMRGNELHIDKEGNVFRDALRLSLKPIWNSYNFFCIYANADSCEAKFTLSQEYFMDRYILAKARYAVETIKVALDDYNLPDAYAALDEFFDILNNWYIRRNRERFWESDKTAHKQAAYDTLYTVLDLVLRAAAPLIPHLAETIYQGINRDDEISVHLQDFPEVAEIDQAAELMADMDKVRNICTTAHALRSKNNIRTRQPLSQVTIIGKGYEQLSAYEQLICDELNVKQVEFRADYQDLAELKLNLNFKLLGSKYGAKVKEIIPAAKQGKWQKQGSQIEVAGILLAKDEFELVLAPQDPEKFQALCTQDALVGLATELSANLINEGYARDLVRLIQQERKEQDFDITDRISVKLVVAADELKTAFTEFEAYIKEQVLADEFSLTEELSTTKEFTIEGNHLKISLCKN